VGEASSEEIQNSPTNNNDNEQKSYGFVTAETHLGGKAIIGRKEEAKSPTGLPHSSNKSL